MSQKLNIIFAGTPDFATDILDYLLTNNTELKNHYHISAIYTQPDRPSGRGKKITASSVKQYTQSHDLSIPVEQPVNLRLKENPENIEKLKQYKPDLIIVAAYGLILPKVVLDIPTYGCINIHASILPRWRGAAPIQRAILAGDTITGITIQQMETGLDTGPVMAEATCDITHLDTTTTLTEKLINLSKPLVLNTIQNIVNNNINLIPQDNNLATYAHKLSKTEGKIDWSNSATYIDRQIKALNPWPSCYATLNNLDTKQDITFKIFSAEIVSLKLISKALKALNDLVNGSIVLHDKQLLIKTSTDFIKIKQLQFSGGKPITDKDFFNSKYKDLFFSNKLT